MPRRGALALPLLLTACAAYPSGPMRKADEVTAAAAPPVAAAPEAPAATPPAAPVAALPPPAVTENHAFATVNGVPLYRIGPGDVLDVVVMRGLSQDRQTVTVRSDGTVSVGLATAKVDGATVEEAADLLQVALAQYFREPRVEVAVKEYVSKRVTLLGAVGASPGKGGTGVYTLTGRNTLSEVLAKAGGPAPNADLQHVQLARADGSRYTINLFRLIAEGETREDPVLDAGDTVFLPILTGAAGTPAEQARVFIFGEARAPGAYAYSPNMHLSQAVAMAGGVSDSGLAESVRVIRGGLDKPEIIEANFHKLLVDGDRRQDVALQPGDIVMIPRTGIGNWNAFLAQIRPTLEFLTLTTATVSSGQSILLQQRAIDRGPAFR
ncbi:MAG TPA: SLBB domain-containing protein [Candidatus Sulfotelmatobacter sp.]|nr:SLBB domain-containing protein [Candidatus Sulfotelmatobacter sp.]